MERVILASTTRETKTKRYRKYDWHFYTPPPLDRFDQVQICAGLDLNSNPSLERWTEFGVDCMFVKQSVSISLVHTWTSLTCGRVLHCCKKNVFNSMCLVSRVDLFASDHTQRCRGITAQDLLCRLIRLLGIASKLQQLVPLLSQAHAFTGSRACSSQLSFTTAERDRRLFSARRGDWAPAKSASQP